MDKDIELGRLVNPPATWDRMKSGGIHKKILSTTNQRSKNLDLTHRVNRDATFRDGGDIVLYNHSQKEIIGAREYEVMSAKNQHTRIQQR